MKFFVGQKVRRSLEYRECVWWSEKVRQYGITPDQTLTVEAQSGLGLTLVELAGTHKHFKFDPLPITKDLKEWM